MEYIFVKSEILSSIIDDPLTPEYIKTNFTSIIPESNLIQTLHIDFEHLYNNKLSLINNKIIVLNILHKYVIREYYNILLDNIIWDILGLELKAEELCKDIKNDIINHNKDFKRILEYLIEGKKNNLVVEDFTFSILLFENRPKCFADTKEINPNMMIKYDLLDVLKYVHNIVRIEFVYQLSARYGRLNIFKWACKNKYKFEPNVCIIAAKYGNFELLKWAMHVGFPFDKITCANIASHGNLEMLKLARENGCPWDGETCNGAAYSGNLELLKWARSNGCPWGTQTYANAIISGNIEVLEWVIRNNGCSFSADICAKAAKHNRIEILKWARSIGIKLNSDTCMEAAGKGNFEILKWARNNGCPWDARTCSAAATIGNLDIIKWARENGCPWDNKTCYNAAQGGHLHVLKWAKYNGCPFEYYYCYSTVLKYHNKNTEMIRWLDRNDDKYDSTGINYFCSCAIA